jgi:hypothetical protein
MRTHVRCHNFALCAQKFSRAAALTLVTPPSFLMVLPLPPRGPGTGSALAFDPERVGALGNPAFDPERVGAMACPAPLAQESMGGGARPSNVRRGIGEPDSFQL